MKKNSDNRIKQQLTQSEIDRFLLEMDSLASHIAEEWQNEQTAVPLLEEMRQERDVKMMPLSRDKLPAQ